jgi:hypothetical protein
MSAGTAADAGPLRRCPGRPAIIFGLGPRILGGAQLTEGPGGIMQVIVGPIVIREGGSFDCWTPNTGLNRGYPYAASKTGVMRATSS